MSWIDEKAHAELARIREAREKQVYPYFREFETGGGHYTWWSPMSNARARNVGWRIDYFLLSNSLRPRLKHAFIRKDIPGSDHCPVGIEIE